MNQSKRTNNEELISAYLDGELSGDDQQRAEQLLREDAELRQAYDELTALRETLKALPVESLDEGFFVRVLRRAERESLVGDSPAGGLLIEPHRDGNGRGRSRRIFWAVASAAALVLIVCVPLLRPRPELAVSTAPSNAGRARTADTAGEMMPAADGQASARRGATWEERPLGKGGTRLDGIPNRDHGITDDTRLADTERARTHAKSATLTTESASVVPRALNRATEARGVRFFAELPAPSAEEVPEWLAVAARGMETDIILQVDYDPNNTTAPPTVQNLNQVLLDNGIYYDVSVRNSPPQSADALAIAEQAPADVEPGDRPAAEPPPVESQASDAASPAPAGVVGTAATQQAAGAGELLQDPADWGLVVVEAPADQVVRAIQDLNAQASYRWAMQIRVPEDQPARAQQANGDAPQQRVADVAQQAESVPQADGDASQAAVESQSENRLAQTDDGVAQRSMTLNTLESGDNGDRRRHVPQVEGAVFRNVADMAVVERYSLERNAGAGVSRVPADDGGPSQRQAIPDAPAADNALVSDNAQSQPADEADSVLLTNDTQPEDYERVLAENAGQNAANAFVVEDYLRQQTQTVSPQRSPPRGRAYIVPTEQVVRGRLPLAVNSRVEQGAQLPRVPSAEPPTRMRTEPASRPSAVGTEDNVVTQSGPGSTNGSAVEQESVPSANDRPFPSSAAQQTASQASQRTDPFQQQETDSPTSSRPRRAGERVPDIGNYQNLRVLVVLRPLPNTATTLGRSLAGQQQMAAPENAVTDPVEALEASEEPLPAAPAEPQ